MNSFSPTPNPNTPQVVNQDQLEEWGAHCSLPNCNMLDFLPLSCPECSKLFCSNHFKPSLLSSDVDHRCEKLIIKLENEKLLKQTTINSEKPVNNGGDEVKEKKKCSYHKCKTILITPIDCRSCKRSYCPSHRLEQDHLCNSITSTAPTHHNNPKPTTKTKTSTATTTTSTSKTSNTNHHNLTNLNSTIRSYFSSNLQQNTSQTNRNPNPTTTTNSNKSQPSSKLNTINQQVHQDNHDHKPLNHHNSSSLLLSFSKFKSNQRNQSELQSQQKALEFRIKNGLLTERDKQEISRRKQQQRGGGGDGGKVGDNGIEGTPSSSTTRSKNDSTHPQNKSIPQSSSTSDCCIV